MTVRVEFCGVPASGKSALCAGALDVLKNRGFPVLGRDAMVDAGLRARNFGIIGNLLGSVVPRWRRDFLGLPHGLNDWHRFVVAHPGFAALTHQWLAAEALPESWRDCVFYALLTTAHEYELAQVANRPVLLDEGFAQRFFTLRGYRGLGRSDDAELYAASMPLPSAMILVATPPDICVERLKRRDQIPVLLQTETPSMLPARLAEGSALLDHLAVALNQRQVPVLRVEGTGDPRSICETLARFVEPLLPS